MMKEGCQAKFVSIIDKIARCHHDIDASSTAFTKIDRNSMLVAPIDNNIPSIDFRMGQWEIPRYLPQSISLL
eukprot:scaffold762_cov363-Pavlova_lutheri.AAC.90